MFKRYLLDNGVRVVCEKIPYVKSVSVGIWVGTGSRNESKENNGISHFIEHMLFKGTSNRSASEIAECIDSIGGQLNAFTGKECTCYYAKTLDSHIDVAVDILADMFFNSRFSGRDIGVERKVIMEEINMYEDSPEELVHDLLSETVWDGNSLGYPILGTKECLNKINRDMIKRYTGTNYTPGNCVAAVAGNFDDDSLLKVITRYFADWDAGKNASGSTENVVFNHDIKIREKDIEQVHMCIGFEGIEHGNDELYSLLAVNSVLGGGMSSRLFQKIREERGLVYSIYSYPSSYKDAGMFTIYAGMKPEHLKVVAGLIVKEIKNLLKRGLGREELAKAKEQLKGNYILGLESTSSRMNSIGKSELLLDYIVSPDDVLKKIDAVSEESVSEVIKKVLDINRISISLVGNINSDMTINEIVQ